MKNQLNKNPHYLLIYFNVMILSKAFKLNKVLLLNNNTNNTDTIGSNKNDDTQANDRSRPSSFSAFPANNAENTCQNDEYDADGELSIQENFYETTYKQRLYLNGYTSHSKYRYDLILFPRILELCLNFISSFQQDEELPQLALVKTSEDAAQFETNFAKCNTIIEQFSKRLLYLLESCNFNIHILINQNFRHFFIDLIQKTTRPSHTANTIFLSEHLNSYLKLKQQSTEHYFEILYYISLYDLNEPFLDHLFQLIIDTEAIDRFTASSSFNLKYLSQFLSMRDMSANLLFKLAENLQMLHCTHFLRLPYQPHQEPIDYLLETSYAPKKWKINLNYEPHSTATVSESSHKSTSGVFTKFLSSPQSSLDGSNSPKTSTTEPHLNRMIRESAQNICCIKIPLKFNQHQNQQQQQQLQQTNANTYNQFNATAETIRHSYSLSFMLRFDDNLINFSKSYGKFK